MSAISDYKKLHPEYANIPDLDLAEVMFEKVYKNKGLGAEAPIPLIID